MPLYLVATPIGNLEDISLRALRILRECDLIACEDTRTSSVLLNKYNIHKKLTSFHIHNENQKLDELLNLLKAGKNIAVISDAGTPGISDPGWILLKRAQENNIAVDVIPGASAVIPAVLLSGFNPERFIFLGFPPEKSQAAKKLYSSLKNLPLLLAFYISPHKILKNLDDILEIFDDRQCALIRELTKIHQEIINTSLKNLREKILNDGQENKIRGELVLIISGCDEKNSNDLSWQEEADKLFNQGESVKTIMNLLAEKYFLKNNVIKNYLRDKNL